MNDRPETPAIELHRPGPPFSIDDEHSERDEWVHDFRNALGTILVAANVANISFPGQQDAEFSIAMERIEDGCLRCLRLLRTMPTA